MKITVIEISPAEISELLSQNIIDAEPIREPSREEIRQWAIDSGLPVSRRGNLPKDVVERFYSEVIYRG